jgi:hypothetical protein
VAPNDTALKSKAATAIPDAANIFRGFINRS